MRNKTPEKYRNTVTKQAGPTKKRNYTKPTSVKKRVCAGSQWSVDKLTVIAITDRRGRSYTCTLLHATLEIIARP